jgi:putative oxidoreductase
MQNSKKKNIALLILRILVGGMFVFAGLMKFIDMPQTILMMSTMGINETVVWMVSIGEVLAGLGVLAGVYTKVAALGIAIIMAGAIVLTKGNIMTILFFVLALLLMYQGGGDYQVKFKKPTA